MNTKTVYKLLETIELPIGTSVHMLNGKDYTINDNGELVRSDGYKLPISKKNIDSCEFTINEEEKNYNFRVYKDNELIECFNKITTRSKAKELGKYFYDSYRDKYEDGHFISHIRNEQSSFDIISRRGSIINVEVEEIVESK